MTTTPKLGIPLISSQQNQPEVTHNAAIIVIQAMIGGAIDQQNAPPGAPDDGDTYIIGSVPTGAWVGHANKIATFLGGWVYLPGVDSDGLEIAMGADQEGLSIYNQALNGFVTWDGAAWGSTIPIGGPFVAKAGDTMSGALHGTDFTMTGYGRIGSASAPAGILPGNFTVDSLLYVGEQAGANQGARATFNYAPGTMPNSQIICASIQAIADSGGPASDLRALRFDATGSGSGNFVTITAVQGTATSTTSGTSGQNRAFVGSVIVSGALSTVGQGQSFQSACAVSAGTLTEYRGQLIGSPAVTGAGLIPTSYGVKINAQKVAGVTTGIALGALGTNAAEYSFFGHSVSFGKITAPNARVDARLDDAVTATFSDVWNYSHTSSGTAAAGFAVAGLWKLENASGTEVTAARQGVRWPTTPTAGSERSEYFYQTMLAGTLADRVFISPEGYLRSPAVQVLTADFPAVATAALANVTGLSMNVFAAGKYNFEFWGEVDATALGGCQVAIAGTCTATSIIYKINGQDEATGTNSFRGRKTALGGAQGAAGATAVEVMIRGSITVNASGTLTVQFAQNAANGTSTLLRGAAFKIWEAA